ncbi:small basic family protein [Clostridium sp. DL1XJH146]
MFILVGLLIGVLIGLFGNISIPLMFSSYLSVAILASMDSVFGGLRALIEEKFRSDIFISGFFGNAILAVGLTYLGDKLDMPIYIAAVIVFGSRIFNNFSSIRRSLIEKIEKSKLH